MRKVYLTTTDGRFILANGHKILIAQYPSSMIFPEFNGVDAAVSKFKGIAFGERSTVYSIHVDKSAVTNSESASYTVMGSNLSPLEADMVPVSGSATLLPLATAWNAANFPFKYIGIKYEAGPTTTGDITFYWEQKAVSTGLN